MKIWVNKRGIEYARFAGEKVEAIGYGVAQAFDERQARLILDFCKKQGWKPTSQRV